MQNFRTAAGRVYSFEDDVVAVEAGGAYSFQTVAGALLSTPADLAPCANNEIPGPTLAQAQIQQAATIRAACAAAIGGSFASPALGVGYTYGSDATDQANIATAAVTGGSLWCADSTGKWSLVSHTAAQAQQVRSDLWMHIQACQAEYAGLLSKIIAATTVAAVRLVVWP